MKILNKHYPTPKKSPPPPPPVIDIKDNKRKISGLKELVFELVDRNKTGNLGLKSINYDDDANDNVYLRIEFYSKGET